MKNEKQNILSLFCSPEKKLAVLVDPDKLFNSDKLLDFSNAINQSSVDFVFVGGSLLTTSHFEKTVSILKSRLKKPLILFPGNHIQLSNEADALLLLSLISGRNAEFLIGQHVVAAPYIKQLDLETIPTGYMLIDGGKPTTASYISNTYPIPANKPDIACSTAIAGELLGLKLIYLDAGSGAENPVSVEMISAVKKSLTLPLIVGGGIKTPTAIDRAWSAGADCVVVGTAMEIDLTLLNELEHLKRLSH